MSESALRYDGLNLAANWGEPPGNLAKTVIES